MRPGSFRARSRSSIIESGGGERTAPSPKKVSCAMPQGASRPSVPSAKSIRVVGLPSMSTSAKFGRSSAKGPNSSCSCFMTRKFSPLIQMRSALPCCSCPHLVAHPAHGLRRVGELHMLQRDGVPLLQDARGPGDVAVDLRQPGPGVEIDGLSPGLGLDGAPALVGPRGSSKGRHGKKPREAAAGERQCHRDLLILPDS